MNSLPFPQVSFWPKSSSDVDSRIQKETKGKWKLSIALTTYLMTGAMPSDSNKLKNKLIFLFDDIQET